MDSETILFEHNADREMIQKALEIARNFIMRKKRVLTGGMAIDFALKIKGSSLYPSNKMPDYDFYSPEHEKDAHELADELVEKGFTGVTAIRAFHISTMKVRVNFYDIADISYVPSEVYGRIPVLKTEGFTIVHPSFQIIDQHRSLSLPFEKPPLETIFGRWQKDIKRHSLLIGQYPFEYKLASTECKFIECDITDDVSGNCLFGLPAVQYWLAAAHSEGFIPSCDIKDLGHLEIGKKIICSIPQDACVSFLSTDFEQFISRYNVTPEYYNDLLDKIPRKIVFSTSVSYEVIDTKGLLVSSFNAGNIRVANPQFLMCYFLSMLIIGKYNEKLRNLYEKSYILLGEVVNWAVTQYASKPAGLRGGLRKYLPTVEVYGSVSENWYPAYLYSRYETFNSSVKSEVPKNYYPKDKTSGIHGGDSPRDAHGGDSPRDSTDRVLQAFDIQTSPWFQFDGEKCPPFKPRSKFL